MSRIRVAVLMGGRSAEREVSLSTGKQVLQALDAERYDAFAVDTAFLGKSMLAEGDQVTRDAALHRMERDGFSGLPAAAASLLGPNRPDVAVICLHGRFGEDGTIQGMLELLEIPYTGSGVMASAIAIDKAMSKTVLRAAGIPLPADVTLRGRADADAFLRDFAEGTAPVTCPCVVKPSRQGSTIGISIVKKAGEMPAALDTALAYDDDVLVETFIDGIEITGPVLGNNPVEPLPLVEIVPNDGFYDYEAKYTPGATDEIVPARLTPEQTRLAQELAVRSHEALGCRGFSRTDMLVANDGIWVLEVNTIPGMTPTSLLPRSAQAAGISFPELVERMIELSLEGRTREATPAARP